MTPVRRAPLPPFMPPFDPDPLEERECAWQVFPMGWWCHVHERGNVFRPSHLNLDPDPRHVDDDPEPRRQRPDGVPGPAIVLVIAGIPLAVLIVVAVAWLAR